MKKKYNTSSRIASAFFALFVLIMIGIGVTDAHSLFSHETIGGILAGSPMLCMAITIFDTTHTDGSDNTPGVQRVILFARLSDIATLPVPILDDSTGSGSFSDLVTITGNIIMLPNKNFYQLYCTLETAKLDCKAQGSLDCMSYLNELSLFHPGQSAQLLGLLTWAKNSDLIILVPESDGQFRLLGRAGYPAKLSAGDSTTGATGTDKRGATATFKSIDKRPCAIFTGKVAVSGSFSGNAENVYPAYYTGN